MEIPSPRKADVSRSGHSRGSLTDELRQVLRGELIQAPCSANMAASLYAVSRRTLSRHLKAEGGTFRQVTNETRCEIACMLLAKSDLSAGQIAEILSYSETSAFTRTFRRWTGQPPSAWRKSHLGLAG